MFNSISWEEYLFTIGFIAAAYYAIVLAAFYSRDILLRLKGANVAMTKHGPANQVPQKGKFMGAISNAPLKKIPIKQSVAASDELTIESDPEELLSGQRIDSPAAELYDRLESLFLIMKTKKVKKANYLKSIKTLIVQYPLFKGTPVQQEVSAFIYNHLKQQSEINITVEEINILWLDQNEELIHQSTTKK
ncbi:MAG TPA: hypothetical protein VFW11_22425 [Cyclobacteriaceae bacterium]|nr:hypothetical protein [Cyclobacteriaceae bacterium]